MQGDLHKQSGASGQGISREIKSGGEKNKFLPLPFLGPGKLDMIGLFLFVYFWSYMNALFKVTYKDASLHVINNIRKKVQNVNYL
jgi:hypothetical protein